MAKKKKAAVNKSQLIRDHLAAYPADGPQAIMVALKKKGIEVSESLIGAVKYSGKKKVGSKRPAAGDKISLSTLIQAKKMAEQLGGVEKARDALAALSKLQ